MLYFERAILTMAVLLLIPAGHSMTRVAIVSIAMAKPKSNRATIPTFEIDIVCAMLVTMLLSSANDACRAFRAYKILFSEVFHHLLVVSTIFHASKIRLLTLEAHVI